MSLIKVGEGMFFLGTDIIEIERIKKAVLRQPAFCDRILTIREKEYYLLKLDPFPFLAGRFAAKEAVLKCLGSGLRGLSWQDIEILPDAEGAPIVFLSPNIDKLRLDKGINMIKVSISHSREYAMAVAIGE